MARCFRYGKDLSWSRFLPDSAASHWGEEETPSQESPAERMGVPIGVDRRRWLVQGFAQVQPRQWQALWPHVQEHIPSGAGQTERTLAPIPGGGSLPMARACGQTPGHMGDESPTDRMRVPR